MVEKIQFEVFANVYNEEQTRYTSLNNRGSVYLSLITFILAGIFFKLERIAAFVTNHFDLMLLFLSSWLAILGAVVSTIVSFAVRGYVGWFDPWKVAKEIDEEQPAEAQFYKNRIAELIKSTGINRNVNNRRAFWLKCSGVLLVVGYAFALLFVLVAALHKPA